MLFSSAQAQIGEPESDSRVRNQLDALGLKYSLTDNGNYKVVFDMGEGRTQLVFFTQIHTTTTEWKCVRSPLLP